MGKPALRTSLIWHDEVMSDVVSERPRPITIGPAHDATFVTPELGLPPSFAIVRPGSRGHLLTLGGEMRGTVCIGGVEHDVATLIKISDGFHAEAIGGLDWGVIELDPSGKLKLFFQFVGVDNVPARPLFEHEPEQRASLAFSTVLHGALLFTTYQLYTHTESNIDPTRDLTASYHVLRNDVTAAVSKPAAAAPMVTVNHASMPATTFVVPDMRAHGPKGPGVATGPKSVLDDATQDLFARLTHKTNGLDGLVHVTGGGGGDEIAAGPTTHGGGPGGPGHTHGVAVRAGEIDTGGDRKPSLCVGSDCGGTPVSLTPLAENTDEAPPLTEQDINKVIQHAKARLTSCYQREVNHDSSLAGTVQVRFEIAADGSVTSARVTSSTVHSDAVSECLTQRISFLKFPAKSRAVVNYPFVFAVR